MEPTQLLTTIWHNLAWPLCRLTFFISAGLLIANFIEALDWTGRMARFARPMVRAGNLSDIAGASFSVAFFSGVSANTMLAEAFDRKKINKNELILYNLLNSLPTYFLHLPTVFFITVPLIKGAALIYVGLTFGSAVLRTVFILLLCRVILPARLEHRNPDEQRHMDKSGQKNFRSAFQKTLKRFKKRIKKILRFTVPIYVLIFFLNRLDVFSSMQTFMEEHVSMLAWLPPQSLSIIVFHIAAEFTAGLAAAGALIQDGVLSYREVVLALLVGNVLSSPVRAVRHQFPYFAGIFRPRLAAELILYNQGLRVGSIILVGLFYFYRH
ncbi:MAG TPA: hypothetical protein EYP57_01870 [Thermodesulfobacteriaceae bacterium]|nr:hypothetical protein [Thermodesulfobacteriaceae bacterium]